jgi:superfamily II DNA/RNA helicase
VVREFRDGTIRVMVATDMLARGLDVAHVDHVVNFDLPFEAEDFLHRIGRTARAGRSGKATTFVTTSDVRAYKKLKDYLEGAVEIKDDPGFSFSAQRSFDKAKQKAKALGVPVKSLVTKGKPKKDRYSDLAKKSAKPQTKSKKKVRR